MNAKELLNLDRTLTDNEQAQVEEEMRALAGQLRDLAGQIGEAHREDPSVRKLLHHTDNMVAALELVASNADDLAEDDASIARQKAEAVYSWELLPAYEWNNRFARVVGRLLVVLPKRQHVVAHNLAAQSYVMSMCIAMGHREMPIGETLSTEEARAYRIIGMNACSTAETLMLEISSQTRLAKSDIAHGMDLIQKLATQFDWDLKKLDSSAAQTVN